MLRSSKCLEAACLLAAIVSGGMLLTGVAYAENAGCANQTCKNIQWYAECPNTGIYLQTADCVTCASTDGRCANGNSDPCIEKKNTPQKVASCTILTYVCACGKGKPPATAVEITGNNAGMLVNSGTNVFTCNGT